LEEAKLGLEPSKGHGKPKLGSKKTKLVEGLVKGDN